MHGMPGLPATMGTPGGNAGSISILIERASPSSICLMVGDHREMTEYPIFISANGGKGGNGGNGGRGGKGGHGGRGFTYIFEPEHRKFKVKVTEYPGNAAGTSAAVGMQAGSMGGAQMGYQANQGSSATVGHQAKKGGAAVGYQAPQASSSSNYHPPPPKPITKEKSKSFAHRAADGSDWVSEIKTDAISFAIKRSGNASKQVDKLSIIDWTNQSWLVHVQADVPGGTKKPMWVLSSKGRPSFSTDVLKYLDPKGVQCEAKLVEEIIPPVYKSTDGGRGGDGGAGGDATPGLNGGDGGHISIASKDPLLLMMAHAQAKGGTGGHKGIFGAGGAGGAGGEPGGKYGGHKGESGRTGPSRLGQFEQSSGIDGAMGSVLYLRLDENGQIMQRSAQLPSFGVVSIQAVPLSGSRLFEPSEPFVINAVINNISGISIPPGVSIFPKCHGGSQCISPTFVTTDWVHPLDSLNLSFQCVSGSTVGSEVSVNLIGTIDAAIPLDKFQKFGDVTWPVALRSIVSVPTASNEVVFDLGANIQNLSGILTGTEHKRDVVLQLAIENGLLFVSEDDPSIPTPESPNLWTCPIGSLGIDEEKRVSKRVILAMGLQNFSSIGYTITLFYRGVPVSASQGSVKFIPLFNMEASRDAQVLLVTHSGLNEAAYQTIVAKCSALGLRTATWDFTYQSDIVLGNHFASRLVIAFTTPDGLHPLSAKSALQAHFFDDSVRAPLATSSRPTTPAAGAAPRDCLTPEGRDLDSAVLIVGHSRYANSLKDLKGRLTQGLYTLSDAQTTSKFFGTPNAEDFKAIVDEIEAPYLVQYPDFAVWSQRTFVGKKVEGGLRSTWSLGSAEIRRSSVSLFQRLYFIKDSFTSDKDPRSSGWATFDLALRTALPTSFKLSHLATQPSATFDPRSLAFTESALYYDLKSEFFFSSRPLMFYQQVVDMLLHNRTVFATPHSIEAVLRVLYRLLNAAYWKSFGTSPLRSRWYAVEAGIDAIKAAFKAEAFDLKAIDTAAKAGAKAKDRVKWRTNTLPSRLRDINNDTQNKYDQ
jgi:hypothetical protein